MQHNNNNNQGSWGKIGSFDISKVTLNGVPYRPMTNWESNGGMTRLLNDITGLDKRVRSLRIEGFSNLDAERIAGDELLNRLFSEGKEGE